MRWRRAAGPAVTPDRFVLIAEETGMIVPLGRWVLERACRDAAGWGVDTLLSVNVAARQVREPGFVPDLERILADTGWPGDRLQVELTETDLMGGAATLETLHAIAARGVRIAIDDFGTGYSNLAYLRRLPVHTLKLAAPFVRDIATDELDADIAALLVRLGHGLGMTVVAEAVETGEQRDRLRALGCDVAQGYQFAPPLPAEQVPAHLR